MGSFTSHSQVFPLQQIIMQQKVDQLCKWAFSAALEGESEAITHSKLRPLADFFAFFFRQIFVLSPLTRPVGTTLTRL